VVSAPHASALTHALTREVVSAPHASALTHALTREVVSASHASALTHALTREVVSAPHASALTHALTREVVSAPHASALTHALTREVVSAPHASALTRALTMSRLLLVLLVVVTVRVQVADVALQTLAQLGALGRVLLRLRLLLQCNRGFRRFGILQKMGFNLKSNHRALTFSKRILIGHNDRALSPSSPSPCPQPWPPSSPP
jgi:hypothetical protein